MMINGAGIDLLKECEGLKLAPYLDSKGVCTIGFGTIIYPDGRKVSLSDQPITEDQAISFLNIGLKDKAATIESWLKKNQLTISGNQFSALLCFAYNEGCGPIINSGSSLNKAILSGLQLDIRQAFSLYNKIIVNIMGIKVKKSLPGLTERRKKEADLYFS